jgi:putative endonuclease
MRQRIYCVYIRASKSRVIYVGVTGFLMARVLRHKAGEGGAFTQRYRVHRLVYFQSFHNIGDAIARETEIKKWRRERKVALIEERNPTWEDLAEGWGGPAVMRRTTTADSSPGLPRFGMTKVRLDSPFLYSPTLSFRRVSGANEEESAVHRRIRQRD